MLEISRAMETASTSAAEIRIAVARVSMGADAQWGAEATVAIAMWLYFSRNGRSRAIAEGVYSPSEPDHRRLLRLGAVLCECHQMGIQRASGRLARELSAFFGFKQAEGARLREQYADAVADVVGAAAANDTAALKAIRRGGRAKPDALGAYITQCIAAGVVPSLDGFRQYQSSIAE